MKLKQIHKFVADLVPLLRKRRDDAIKEKLPKENIEYEEGRLYEAQYILDVIEKIIYEDGEYKF